MRFNGNFERFCNMIMESLNEKKIANYFAYATKWDKAKRKFKQFQKNVDLNDPIHVERLKKIVEDEIAAFNFPPGKRIFPTYAYQKTIYELEKKFEQIKKSILQTKPYAKIDSSVSFTFDQFTKILRDVIHNKVYNDKK
jgi:hypothetical protein